MKKQLNAKQEAKLNSFRATERHVDGNITLINKIPAFLANYNKIKTNIAVVFNNAEEKSAALTGITAGKTNSRQIVSTKTVAIAGLVYTYAADIGDQTLRAEMNINQTRLKRTRDDELAPLCQFVHNRTAAHLAALVNYNITSDRLADLQTAIDNYSAETPKPRAAVSTRKTTNANIVATFKELDDLFDRFDRQVESLTEEHPDFVRTYFSTREIVGPAARSKKPGNTVSSSDAPMTN
jgi:hypothetical protein